MCKLNIVYFFCTQYFVAVVSQIRAPQEKKLPDRRVFETNFKGWPPQMLALQFYTMKIARISFFRNSVCFYNNEKFLNWIWRHSSLINGIKKIWKHPENSAEKLTKRVFELPKNELDGEYPNAVYLQNFRQFTCWFSHMRETKVTRVDLHTPKMLITQFQTTKTIVIQFIHTFSKNNRKKIKPFLRLFENSWTDWWQKKMILNFFEKNACHTISIYDTKKFWKFAP